MPQSGLSLLCFAEPLSIHRRSFVIQWASRRRPRICTLLLRVLAAFLLAAFVHLFVLLCTSCLPLRSGSVFPHARRISIARAPWSPMPSHNGEATVDVLDPSPSPFATGKDCCIVLSALAKQVSQVMNQTGTADVHRRQNSSNDASKTSSRHEKHNSDAEHYVLAVLSALSTMPDAHVFLLVESLTVVAFRRRFQRTLIASLKDGSPRLHLVNLDLLDEHLCSRATWHASFGAVGRGDGDRDEFVERELTLLQSYVAFRDFLDHWPGVSGSCAQLLLLDSPLALLQHSPFHAYAGRVRPTPSHSFLGQSERSEAAASTQNIATSSEREAQFAPLNEYLLFTEAHVPQHSSLQTVHSRDSRQYRGISLRSESRKTPSERLESAVKWWQWHLAERCLGQNAARVLFAGAEAQPPLLATGAILGTFAAVQRFVTLQGEQIMRLSATAQSGSCLHAAAQMDSQTHKRYHLRTLLARYALHAILEDAHANLSIDSYIHNLVDATRRLSLLVPHDQSPVFETPDVAFTALERQEKSEVKHENCTVRRRFNTRIRGYEYFDVPPVVLLHSVENLRQLAQNCFNSLFIS